MHDLREVGFQLTDNERDIAATAAAVTHWHRMEPPVPAVRWVDGRHQRRVCAALHAMWPRPLPSDGSGSDRRRRGRPGPLAAGRASRRGEIEFRCSPASWSLGSRWSRPSTAKIGEEVDVSLSELRYFGSQPWPFPRSLMVGFFARADRDRHLRGCRRDRPCGVVHP